MSLPALLTLFVGGLIACIFLVVFVYLGRVVWRVLKASQSGNPNEVRNSLKSTLFHSKSGEEVWNAQIGEILQDLGTYKYNSYLWADDGWVRYTVYLTQATAGKQLLFAWQSRGGELVHFPISGHACQRLAEILKEDETTFISEAERYDRLAEPPVEGLMARLKGWFIRRFHFHALKEYGLIDERRIYYPNSIKSAWEQTIHAYLSKKRGAILLILKEKSITYVQVYRWYVFDASGRETLRNVLQRMS